MTVEPATIASARTESDLVAVRALFAIYRASIGIDLAYQRFEVEVATLPGAYAPPDGALLLARGAAGEPLGCVALRPLGDGVAEIKRLFVLPAARGLGLGGRLMSAIVGEARRIGYRALRLDTLPSMTRAQTMYRAVGFETIEPYYPTPIAGTVFLGLTLIESARD
jgi:ribosomal protein S18 acetylase RimI-like enzyme